MPMRFSLPNSQTHPFPSPSFYYKLQVTPLLLYHALTPTSNRNLQAIPFYQTNESIEPHNEHFLLCLCTFVLVLMYLYTRFDLRPSIPHGRVSSHFNILGVCLSTWTGPILKTTSNYRRRRLQLNGHGTMPHSYKYEIISPPSLRPHGQMVKSWCRDGFVHTTWY